MSHLAIDGTYQKRYVVTESESSWRFSEEDCRGQLVMSAVGVGGAAAACVIGVGHPMTPLSSRCNILSDCDSCSLTLD